MVDALRPWLRRLAVAALALVSACGQPMGKNTSSEAMMNEQNTQNWKTHCFGRMVMKLPADTKIGQDYKIDGDLIAFQQGLSVESAQAQAAAREAALRAATHKTAGTMFHQRVQVDGASAVLLSYTFDSKLYSQEYAAWFADAKANKVWTQVGSLATEREASAIAFLQYNARTIRSRAPDEIPTTPGFCIEQGIMGDERFQVEGYDVHLSFASMPYVSVRISSTVVGEPLSKLLDRAPAGLATLAKLISGTRTLRSRDRTLDNIAGQEMLLRMSADGNRVHYFRWESPGVAKSMAQAHVGIELTTLNSDDNGKFYDSHFKTDEEALAFWDALLSTFKLRPGAL